MSRVSLVGLVILAVASGLMYLPVAAFVVCTVGQLARIVGGAP
jgi:hypothetical protein